MQPSFPATLVILGAAGGGKLMYWHVKETYPEVRILFVDDGIPETFLEIAGDTIPVVHDWRFDTFQRDGTDDFRHFLVSPTYPPVKKSLVGKALAAGLSPAPTLIHPKASFLGRPTISIGRGGLIAPNTLIHNDNVIGDYVHVATGAIIGHDCRVDDYAAINPAVMILGYTHIMTGVAIGAGTMVRDHLTIAPWVQTGMQACVTKSIDEEGITVVGVPAHPLRKPPHETAASQNAPQQ